MNHSQPKRKFNVKIKFNKHETRIFGDPKRSSDASFEWLFVSDLEEVHRRSMPAR